MRKGAGEYMWEKNIEKCLLYLEAKSAHLAKMPIVAGARAGAAKQRF